MKKKTVKEVKMHKYLVSAYKFQDFRQIQKKIAQSHDCVTMTFKNSELTLIIVKTRPGDLVMPDPIG